MSGTIGLYTDLSEAQWAVLAPLLPPASLAVDRAQRAGRVFNLLRFSKDYEFKVQTSKTLTKVAATRLMLNRIAPKQELL